MKLIRYSSLSVCWYTWKQFVRKISFSLLYCPYFTIGFFVCMSIRLFTILLADQKFSIQLDSIYENHCWFHRENITIERRYQMKVYTLLILTQTNIYLFSQCVQKNSKEIFWNLKSEALEYHSNFKENKIF